MVNVFVELVQLFVDGRAPEYLRQFYGGGNLTGIGKDGVPLEEDARPIVCGEAWRQVACNVALGEGKAALQGWLRPNQMAVGVPAATASYGHVGR